MPKAAKNGVAPSIGAFDEPLIADARRKSEENDSCFYANILNDIMHPRYDQGERAIVNKSLRPVVGDDVMIVLKGSDGMGCILRRLAGFDGTSLRLLQYNPRLETDLELDRVAEILPVRGNGDRHGRRHRLNASTIHSTVTSSSTIM
jgi:phage repressor protein C with HTH and peptisase S24 domain